MSNMPEMSRLEALQFYCENGYHPFSFVSFRFKSGYEDHKTMMNFASIDAESVKVIFGIDYAHIFCTISESIFINNRNF